MHKTPNLKSLLAAAALCGASLVAPGALAQEALRIGAVNPYSGPLALYGDEMARGYQIAIDERNAKGGVLGRKIELVRGDATNPQQGIAAVDQLVTREKAEMFIGSYVSAIANAGSDAALRHNKLWWDTNALAVELTERKLPNFVRSGPYAVNFAETAVRATADMIAPALNKPLRDLSVWIEHEDSIYGKSIAEAAKRDFEKRGVKVLGVGAHNFRAADLTDVVLRARRGNPDVWMQIGYVVDGNLMLRTAREQGYKPSTMLWVGTGDTFETLDALGADFLEGLFVVSYPRPDIAEKYSPGGANYLAQYRKAHNREPIAPQSFAAYSGMRILLDAVEAAGSTAPEKVRAAALAMDKPFGTYPAGFGVKFDDKLQNTRAVPAVIQWQAGKQVTVFPVEARNPGIALKNTPRKQ